MHTMEATIKHHANFADNHFKLCRQSLLADRDEGATDFTTTNLQSVGQLPTVCERTINKEMHPMCENGSCKKVHTPLT